MRTKFLCISAVTAALAFQNAAAQVTVFEDDFSTDTSAQYTVLQLDHPEAGIDSEAQFSFDYSSAVNGFGDPISIAPGTTDGDTKALWLTANYSLELNRRSFIDVYTKDEFSGDYQVFVDVYCSVNDDAVGTTNHYLFGINHSGEKLVNAFQAVVEDTDGYFWAQANENGAGTTDVFLMEGGPTEDGTDDSLCGTWFIETPVTDCYIPADGAVDGVPRPYNALFETLYLFSPIDFSPANGWTTVRMDYVDGVVTVFLKSEYMDDLEAAKDIYPWLQTTEDGFVKLVEYADPDMTFTSGKILLGFEDAFDSRFTQTQFVLFDNLKVVQLSPASNVNSWSLFN